MDTATRCYVTASDYSQWWLGQQPEIKTGQLVYNGPERRGVSNRRVVGHERRWEAGRGRRFDYERRRTGRAQEGGIPGRSAAPVCPMDAD
jgi:hypothetical protein